MQKLRFLTSCLILFLWPFMAYAAATTLAVNGDVRFSMPQAAGGLVAVGQRIESGATLKTGSNAGITLRFDDGQMVALSGGSVYVVDDYRFNPQKPEQGGFVSSLLKGGMRAVSGLIGELNPKDVQVKTVTATVGIRGTDFDLFFDGKLYMTVRRGAIAATNDAGEKVFAADGQASGMVLNKDTLARPATLAEFPAEAQAAFRQLDGNPDLGAKARNPNDPNCSDRR